jgi:cell division protein FtsN
VTVLSKAPAPEPAKPAAPPAKAEPKPEPKPAAKPPAAAPAPVPAKPAAAGGPSRVQIGAFSSAAIAEKEWSAAVAKGGGGGRGKRIEKVERDGSTLFRTTVTGFPDRTSAQAFCDRLKSAGKSCFVR